MTTHMDTIICGDCLEVMTGLASGSIDLAVTSAPFNLLNSVGGGMRATSRHSKWANAAIRNGYATYHDCLPHDEYVGWQRDCLSEIMRSSRTMGHCSTTTRGESKTAFCKIDRTS